MLLHILIMALFTLFVGGIQLVLKHVKGKPLSESFREEEQPIKKAV